MKNLNSTKKKHIAEFTIKILELNKTFTIKKDKDNINLIAKNSNIEIITGLTENSVHFENVIIIITYKNNELTSFKLTLKEFLSSEIYIDKDSILINDKLIWLFQKIYNQ